MRRPAVSFELFLGMGDDATLRGELVRLVEAAEVADAIDAASDPARSRLPTRSREEIGEALDRVRAKLTAESAARRAAQARVPEAHALEPDGEPIELEHEGDGPGSSRRAALGHFGPSPEHRAWWVEEVEACARYERAALEELEEHRAIVAFRARAARWFEVQRSGKERGHR